MGINDDNYAILRKTYFDQGKPIETVKVLIGLWGTHYHQPGCAMVGNTKAPNYDYIEIELPKIWVERELSIEVFGRIYDSHWPMCIKKRPLAIEKIILE